MSCLLDTSIIMELGKGDRCHANVAGWFATVRNEDLFLSVTIIGDVWTMIERCRADNPEQAKDLEKWLHRVVLASCGRLLPLDQSVMEAWGQMRFLHPTLTQNGLMAATAKAHDLALVTNQDTKLLAELGITVVNPFLYRDNQGRG